LKELKAEREGKRRRTPTIGQYCGLAEAKKTTNDERERELRLENEVRIIDMVETLDILRKAHLDPEDEKEKVVHVPTADITSQLRESQVEVVRISKVNNNLKGDLQRAFTMAGIEVLRTRVDATEKKTGEDVMRRMRDKVEKLEKT